MQQAKRKIFGRFRRSRGGAEIGLPLVGTEFTKSSKKGNPSGGRFDTSRLIFKEKMQTSRRGRFVGW